MECRKETAYALHKTLITKTIREKEYQFLITTAYCKECGCEVGVKGILDYNTKEIDEQFRKAEGIISNDEIEKLIKNDKIYIATYSIIIFILASLFSKNNYILFNILKYYNYSNLFFFILIPLIAFTAFSMKSSKKA